MSSIFEMIMKGLITIGIVIVSLIAVFYAFLLVTAWI